MDNDTLTLALNGEVPLQEFAQALNYFNALVQGLSNEIAHDAAIEWVIDTLEAGSAITTVKGETEQMERLAAVITGYATVGKALHTHQPIPYSDKVRIPAQNLTKLLNGHITSLRFETSYDDYIVESRAEGKPALKPTYAYGRLKGIVQTLSARRGIRFTLYDVLSDRPIAGYLKESQEELIRPYWGKKVYVSGKIGRDPKTGRAFAIREISDIQAVESKPGGFRRARGILDLAGETSESITAALRNG
ncbi:MAG: hypothetical protein B6D41_10360 [Chloroflexi bacterium UTCFX4]|jgi:hypothetical protein|nr:MAG: hypothetical protein B6D41_10360 [Chloroflexi bacterium UTCFX4]